MYIYLINADSQKEKERVKELKTGMRQRKTQGDRWKQEDRDTNTRLGERERWMDKSGASGENSERNGLSRG